MAGRLNTIILTPDRATFDEGIIATGETPKPGQIVQIDPTVALQGGRHTWKLYNRDADGDHPAGPHIVLVEDFYQGKTTSDAYAAGERAFGAVPRPGCELNLLKGDVAGTGDDFALGSILMVDDGTGKVVLTTGSPECEVAVCLETITDPTADVLVWCRWGVG